MRVIRCPQIPYRYRKCCCQQEIYRQGREVSRPVVSLDWSRWYQMIMRDRLETRGYQRLCEASCFQRRTSNAVPLVERMEKTQRTCYRLFCFGGGGYADILTVGRQEKKKFGIHISKLKSATCVMHPMCTKAAYIGLGTNLQVYLVVFTCLNMSRIIP
jgi:hypothetical protein